MLNNLLDFRMTIFQTMCLNCIWFEISTESLVWKIKFLTNNGFSRGKIDTILFAKSKDDEQLIVQINYVDDINFWFY